LKERGKRRISIVKQIEVEGRKIFINKKIERSFIIRAAFQCGFFYAVIMGNALDAFYVTKAIHV